MKTFKFLVIVIVIVVVLTAGWIFKMVFVNQSGPNEMVKFSIEQGTGVNKISRDLKQSDLIDNSFVFETYLWLLKSEGRLLAGEHQLNPNWNLRQVVLTLTTGKTLDNETVIKSIEGWDLYDLADYFAKNDLMSKDDFFELAGNPGQHDNANNKDWSDEYEFLKEKPVGVSLEGYLFPDTYRIFKNAKPEDIVRKMLDNFGKKVDAELLVEIQKQKKTLYDVLTLASIVEKEAQTKEDKKKVAGVYYNRLKIGMALQADPTVNYITGKQTDRPTYADLKVESLYNTYKYPGLPPGPISNPGLDSILAAVYPDNNNYFYFINTPAGDMVFGRTLEEHVANRVKYFINN